ncbi:hypothetical protein VIBNIAM115_1210092 [Vibrio nigripulchritudo AM115]|nr:hypothetical protein VIBNIAM115_1210092 [Vibrio nigripulchritudo AM115]
MAPRVYCVILSEVLIWSPLPPPKSFLIHQPLYISISYSFQSEQSERTSNRRGIRPCAETACCQMPRRHCIASLKAQNNILGDLQRDNCRSHGEPDLIKLREWNFVDKFLIPPSKSSENTDIVHFFIIAHIYIYTLWNALYELIFN